MKAKMILLLALVLSCNLVAGPVLAQTTGRGGTLSDQQAPSGEMMLYDLILVRPVSLAACGIGLVGSVLAMPFAAMSNQDREVSRRLIAEPFAYTFTRPVGHFDTDSGK